MSRFVASILLAAALLLAASAPRAEGPAPGPPGGGGTGGQECAGGASGPGMASGEMSPFIRPDVRALGDELTCYCGCPHLQVSKCYCGTADQIRADFAARLDRGESHEQIVAAYIAEHGESVLAVPPKQGFHWIIWTGPPALLLLGAAGVWLVGRRWARARPAPEAAPAPLDPDVEQRLRAELERAVEGP